MPADLSHDRLGRRALDLLDDMANWGQKKYLPGEVDVFKIDHTHELFGHMNINYVRLEPDRLPRFDGRLAARARQPAFRPVLRHDGRGLDPGISRSTDKPSGSTVVLKPGEQPEVRVEPELDVSAPIRRADLRRRVACFSRPDRLLGHRPLRPEKPAPETGSHRADLGPPGSLGRRGQWRLHTAGVAGAVLEIRADSRIATGDGMGHSPSLSRFAYRPCAPGQPDDS